MPTSSSAAFSAVGVRPAGVVKWGTKLPTHEAGVYAVSLTDSPDRFDATSSSAPLSAAVFERWLTIRPELTLDGVRPSVEDLMRRVDRSWLGDEVIVYIGCATRLSTRVGQYYTTPLGARRPHAGGYFLKLLSNLDQLWVHYATCADPDGAEDGMLRHFCENVSEGSRRALLDPRTSVPVRESRMAAWCQESSWPPPSSRAALALSTDSTGASTA